MERQVVSQAAKGQRTSSRPRSSLGDMHGTRAVFIAVSAQKTRLSFDLLCRLTDIGTNEHLSERLQHQSAEELKQGMV